MKILVIGDSCIDRFIYCNINRICPEAPVPVLQPINTITNPGMAGNVVRNLQSLGVEVELITNQNLITKTRYVDNKSGQMIMRLDENDSCDRIDLIEFSHTLQEQLKTTQYDAIIVSDYSKGFLHPVDMNVISSLITGCPVFLDSKRKLDEFVDGKWCYGFSYIKINNLEYEQNKNLIHKKWNGSFGKVFGVLYDKCIITRGSKGCEYRKQIYKTEKIKVSNVSGAGDTFLAGLVYNFIKTNNIEKSIKFANKCASKVVQERGVTTI
jgi:D-beta-D-heptose 7-phosphate kinase/D-beta-D-heptose 1-phosphate adenosyltransferase